VFDTSIDRDPLEFTLGKSAVIQGFEDAVMGMEPGEKKLATVQADDAYGPYREDMVLLVDRKHFPDETKVEVDQQYEIGQADGQRILVTVTDISDSTVTLDANHPLAGKDLTFEIELVAVG
jgi:peptidylprolyl isomerase